MRIAFEVSLMTSRQSSIAIATAWRSSLLIWISQVSESISKNSVRRASPCTSQDLISCSTRLQEEVSVSSNIPRSMADVWQRKPVCLARIGTKTFSLPLNIMMNLRTKLIKNKNLSAERTIDHF